MAKIAIVTDSGCDLPQALCDEMGIIIVPIYVNWKGQSYKDRIDLNPDSFYPRLKTESELPTTSQPSPGDFYELFKELRADHDEILCLTLSSGLSGTWQSAIAAQDMLTDLGGITVVDTKAASVGQGLLVVEAARMVKAGSTVVDTVSKIEAGISTLRSIFTINTLENLVRGGRLSALQGGLGTLLDIKPVLHLDAEGKIVPLTKVRTRKKALELLDKEIEAQGKDLKGQIMGLSHSREPELAEQKAMILKEKYGAAEVIIGEIGSVIGTHTGAGCIAVFFYGDKRV